MGGKRLLLGDMIGNLAMTDKLNKLSFKNDQLQTRKPSTEVRFTVGASYYRKMESTMRHVYFIAVISRDPSRRLILVYYLQPPLEDMSNDFRGGLPLVYTYAPCNNVTQKQTNQQGEAV